MKLTVDSRDPLHLSALVFSGTAVVITAALFFLLLLQTLLGQPPQSLFHELAADTLGPLSRPQPASPLYNHRKAYREFTASLFHNLRHGVCNPDNATAAQLTRDKNVVPVHSHNDYWRALPVFDALAAGANSIEADIWLLEAGGKNSAPTNGLAKSSREPVPELLVGHNRQYLERRNTVGALYLEPLNSLLDEVNCRDDAAPRGGVFYNSPHTTTFLYIDIKTDAVKTYKAFIRNVLDTSSLHAKDYLTYYRFPSSGENAQGEVVWGPLTLVITGNVPREFIAQEQYADPFNINRRIVFVDAPLLDLDLPAFPYNDTISLTGSASLYQLIGQDSSSSPLRSHDGLSDDQLATVKRHIDKAHGLNIKTRLWDTPDWPVFVRDAVWWQLLLINVDYLNVDDLLDARSF